ncbi:MAG: conjugal transfer protein TraG N-terminal domain-containing protein, partial [Gammaproteobacteria bacterium]
MDMEFVTYAGFDIVGSAFERIALIFATDNYLGLFISFAVLGVIFASIAASVRNFTGQTVTVQAWAIPILLGLVAFQGLMLPKGKVLLYDPVKNDSRVIGDVPQAVVLVAGLFNLIERGVVDAVDLASTSIYADDATGISFSLLHEAAQRPLNVADSFTTKTLSAYIKNCAPVALNSPNSPLSEALVKRGTHDLRDA